MNKLKNLVLVGALLFGVGTVGMVVANAESVVIESEEGTTVKEKTEGMKQRGRKERVDENEGLPVLDYTELKSLVTSNLNEGETLVKLYESTGKRSVARIEVNGELKEVMVDTRDGSIKQNKGMKQKENLEEVEVQQTAEEIANTAQEELTKVNERKETSYTLGTATSLSTGTSYEVLDGDSVVGLLRVHHTRGKVIFFTQNIGAR